MDGLYYRAGAETSPGSVTWSEHTRKTRERAEREARLMARACDGRPIVEYWFRDHGLRPEDSDPASVICWSYVAYPTPGGLTGSSGSCDRST